MPSTRTYARERVDWATASDGPRRQVGDGVNWATPSGGPRRQLGHGDTDGQIQELAR